MKTTALVIIFSFLFLENIYAATLDRAVIEVNKTTFTQRSMELYFTVKSVFESNDSQTKTPFFLNKENWSKYLSQFTRDMVLFKDAQRAGSFLPSKKRLQESAQKIHQTMDQDPNLKKELHRLAVTVEDIAVTLGRVSRVQTYLASKSRSLSTPIKKSQWLEGIVESSVIRFYEGASEYTPLDLSVIGKSKIGDKTRKENDDSSEKI